MMCLVLLTNTSTRQSLPVLVMYSYGYALMYSYGYALRMVVLVVVVQLAIWDSTLSYSGLARRYK